MRFRSDFGFIVSVAWLVGFSATAQDRAHQLAAQAASQVTAQCGNTATSAACHQSQPTGCSHALHSRYDAYLNFLKNQQVPRDLAPMRSLSVTDFHQLEDSIPTGITATNHATFTSKLVQIPGVNVGEGNIYTLMGYLYFVDDTSGTTQKPGETCNCQLSTPNSGDYHLGIGLDPALAQKVRQDKVTHVPNKNTVLEQTSIVAEMTPHTRDVKWTVARIQAQKGKQVKVVGQLLLDNMHANHTDDCSFLADRPPNHTCWRATVWEMHPVIQFFVCKDGATCTADTDTNWIRLEAMP